MLGGRLIDRWWHRLYVIAQAAAAAVAGAVLVADELAHREDLDRYEEFLRLEAAGGFESEESLGNLLAGDGTAVAVTFHPPRRDLPSRRLLLAVLAATGLASAYALTLFIAFGWPLRRITAGGSAGGRGTPAGPP